MKALRSVIAPLAMFVLLPAACGAAPIVVKEVKIPLPQKSFKPLVSGDWVAVNHTGQKNRPVTDIYVYNIRMDKAYTINSSNTGWLAIAYPFVLWPEERSGRNVAVFDLRTRAITYPSIAHGPADGVFLNAGGDHFVYLGKDNGLYLRTLSTGQEVELCSNAKSPCPSVGGDLVVWQDWTDGIQVKGYKISTGEQLDIANGPGVEHASPKTDGRTVVWNIDGCGPDAGVYAYDVATGTTRRIGPARAFFPDVDGDIVIYERNDSRGCDAVFGYKLSTGEEFRISKGYCSQGPDISGNNVTWMYANDAYCAVLENSAPIQKPKK